MEKSPEYFIQVDISLDHSEFMKTKLIFDGEDKVASCITSNQNIIPSLIEVDLASSNWDEEEALERIENEFSETYGTQVFIYEEEHVLSVADDILKSISNKKLLRYCTRLRKQIEIGDDLGSQIDLLNQLMNDKNISIEDDILNEENWIYTTTRNLFYVRGRKSKINQSIRRFTVATKVLEHLGNEKNYVRLEFTRTGNPKVIFHVIEGIFDREILYSKKSPLFQNGCNNYRVNVKLDMIERLWDENDGSEIFIRLENNEIEFLLCE